MYKKFVFLMIIVITMGFSAKLIFHEGAIDKRGGHFDNKTRQYHYHHGCEAHQHPEGKCEFEFKNCERENPKTSSHNHEIAIQ